MADVDRVLRLAERLLGIESVYGDEAAIGDWLEKRLRSAEPHTLVRAGNSLCVSMRAPDPARPTLMLLGHTDTVPKLDDNPVRREGDRLYGLGASDMKAADALRERGWVCDTLRKCRRVRTNMPRYGRWRGTLPGRCEVRTTVRGDGHVHRAMPWRCRNARRLAKLLLR